jgi:hypothetical protein
MPLGRSQDAHYTGKLGLYYSSDKQRVHYLTGLNLRLVGWR